MPVELQAHEYIGVRPEEVSLIFQDKWKILINKMVVLQPVTFRTEKEFKLHQVLRAVDKNAASYAHRRRSLQSIRYMLPLSGLMGKYVDYPQVIEVK